MDLINPYAVMRNTATHEAYKAYSRKAAMAGQPFFMLAILLTTLAPAMISMGTRAFLHRLPADWRFALAAYVIPVFLAAVLLIVGLVRTVRFRKANPIPEEWRQIPRIRTPLVLERKPRLPLQG